MSDESVSLGEAMELSSCTMDTLPLEMKLLVFSFLECGDLSNSKLVCREWLSLLQERTLWSRFMIRLAMNGEAPDPRVCHSCVVYHDSMIIYGGHVPSEGPTFYISSVKNDIFQFHFDTRTWTKLEVENAPGRTEHSAVVYDDRIYYFGGYGYHEGYTSLIHCFDPSTGVFEVVEASGEVPVPRSAHSAVVYKDCMYVFAGWDSDFSRNDLYCFHFESKSWKQIPHKGVEPPPVRSHCAVVHEDCMYVFGGFGDDKHPTEMFVF
jgi:hypothetical protein